MGLVDGGGPGGRGLGEGGGDMPTVLLAAEDEQLRALLHPLRLRGLEVPAVRACVERAALKYRAYCGRQLPRHQA